LKADLAADVFVSGDAARLQQIVWNLLSNAVKFTPSAGIIEIRLAQTGSNVEISVRDNGIGISVEFLPHVFERFEQAEKTKTRRNSGLGLGLAIVRRIVELHGGTVRAESEGEGKGATFTVSLPAIVESNAESVNL
jgi:signal transduction histidine kinase